MPNDILTKEQRKGLLYGSLISAGLAAAVALRNGGDIRDAIGAGTFGAATGYGGGLNEVVGLRKKILDQAHEQELISASEEARKLAGEKFGFEKEHYMFDRLLRAAPLMKERRVERETEEDRKALLEYLAQQKGITEAPGLTGFQRPDLSAQDISLLRAAPRGSTGAIIQEIIKARQPKYEPKPWQTEEDQWSWLRPGEPIPRGAKPLGEVTQRPIVIPLGSEVEIRKGKERERLPVGVSPNVKEIEKNKKERQEEKPEPKAETQVWINMKSFEIAKVNPREGARIAQLQNDPDWMTLDKAMAINPFLKYKLRSKEIAGTQTNPTSARKKPVF